MKRIYYYESMQDDIINSKNQDYEIKDNFKWIHTNIFYVFFRKIFYVFVVIFSFIYSKVFLHIEIKNKNVLKNEKGYFLYSNHTLMLGDVLDPFLITFPHHPYLICSPSNLGIPILGKVLPLAGALPIPGDIHKMIKFKESVNYYANKGNPIIIYPEAHLWPYCNFIREFPNTSFHFPVENEKKVFVATTTFKKRKYFKKPKIIVYIDGPFETHKNLSKKENMNNLHDIVYETMKERSKLSNYKYVEYKKK